MCRNESAESILRYLEANSFEQTVLNKNLHLIEEEKIYEIEKMYAKKIYLRKHEEIIASFIRTIG